VFFDDVRVPHRNLIGAEGDGWACAKYLLELERGIPGESIRLRVALDRIIATAEHLGSNGSSLLADADIAAATAILASDLDSLEILELRMLSDMAAGSKTAGIASVLKLRVSQLRQDVSELGVQILGSLALTSNPVRPLWQSPGLKPEDEQHAITAPAYLNSRAATIYGGSSEIQRQLIAKAILGI
jgi:acyl-CoA dehydrogenase